VPYISLLPSLWPSVSVHTPIAFTPSVFAIPHEIDAVNFNFSVPYLIPTVTALSISRQWLWICQTIVEEQRNGQF
jgi:hypothetical protein